MGDKVRMNVDGKLSIREDNLLLHDDHGWARSIDIKNNWVGFSTLQALFVLEHNTICDALKV